MYQRETSRQRKLKRRIQNLLRYVWVSVPIVVAADGNVAEKQWPFKGSTMNKGPVLPTLVELEDETGK